jgi:hypothetical protein
LLIFCLICTSFTGASATIKESKTDYEVLEHKLSGIPKFCIIEPKKDPILPESLVPLLIKEAKASIDSWKISLKSNNRDDVKWDINTIVISRDKQNSQDKSGCNVIIQFQKKSSGEVDPLSLFKNKPIPYKEYYPMPDYSYQKGKSVFLIQVFYQAKGTCENLEDVDDNSYIITSWDCRQNNVAPIPVLGAIMRHAIGHALGLGHYKGYSNSSIMSELPKMQGFDTQSNPKNVVITSFDVQKLKEIYGNKGWGNLDNTKLSAKEKTTSTKNIKVKTINIKKGQAIIEKISGSVPKDAYKIGFRADLTIIKPDGSKETQKVVVSNNGKFEHPLLITDKTDLGKYTIVVSYFGQEIKKLAYEIR